MLFMNKFFYSLLRSSFAIVTLLLGFSTANAQYCATSYTTQCGGSNSPYIKSFSTTGGVNNITNNNTDCANTTTSYSDYTTLKVTQNAGASVSIKGEIRRSNYLTKVSVYIDWNQDGVFDVSAGSGEEYPWPQIVTGNTNAITTINVTVPITAKDGATRMRIRSVSNGSGVTNIATPVPCGGTNIDEGETEDYTFEVINPCLPPSVLSFANIKYNSAEISWSRKGNARLYEYILSADPTFYPSSAGYSYADTNGRFLALKNLICDTTYRFWIRSICDTPSGKPWDTSKWKVDSFKTPPCCYEPAPKIENITATSAVARWAPIASAYGYEYAVSVQKDPPQNGTYTNYTSAYVQGLMSRQVYYLHVRSRCSPTPLSTWKTVIFKTGKSLSVNAISGNNMMEMNAYPNPVKDQVTVTLEGARAANARLLITDMTGKTLSIMSVTSDVVNVDMSNLPVGVYVIKYVDDTYNKVIKVNKL